MKILFNLVVFKGENYGPEDEFPQYDPNLTSNGFSRSPDRPFGEEPTGMPQYNDAYNSPDRRPDPIGQHDSPHRVKLDPPDGNSYQSPVSSPQRKMNSSHDVVRYDSSPVSSPQRQMNYDPNVSSPQRVKEPGEQFDISSPKSPASSHRSYVSPNRNDFEDDKSRSNGSIDESN